MALEHPPLEQPDHIPVVLRRRTLEEQVEYLVEQVAVMVATINRLERDVEALHVRMCALERATPLAALHRKPTKPSRTGSPSGPLKRPKR